MVDYDSQATKWARDIPLTLADVIAKPIIYERVKKIGEGKILLAGGCGEGYSLRILAPYVKKCIGFDNSKGMIEQAIAKERERQQGIKYFITDLCDMHPIPDSSIDIFISLLSAHYLHPDKLPAFYKEIFRVLNNDGVFFIAMPHPSFLLSKFDGYVWNFDIKDFNYHKSRGASYTGTIKTTIGTTLSVGGYHSKLEDHFEGIHQAGLAITRIKEPPVSTETVRKYPIFKVFEGEVLFKILEGIKLR